MLYLLYNAARGVRGYGSGLRPVYWRTESLPAGGESPGRKYLDRFLAEELPRLVPPHAIRVLDIGCGSGYLREVLDAAGYRGTYVGVDVKRSPKFEERGTASFTSTFVHSPIESFRTRERFDLVVSNTALEHIADDRGAVEKSRRYTARGGVQVHIVPSFWGLLVYLWHGYRQYTPRRMTTLFAGQRYRVYRLGGLCSLLLHFVYLTVPGYAFRIRERRNVERYSRLVRLCNRLDRYVPFCSYMYVVVIHS